MDEVALITGAAHRIGAQIAQDLHRRGHRIVIHFHRRKQEADALIESLNAIRPDSTVGTQGDLTDPETCRAIVGAALDTFGRLDVLVNNASVYERSPIGTPDVDQFDTMLATNLRAPYLLSTHAVDQLRATNGLIINITDIYALRPQSNYAVYCASKAGLVGLTKAMARDLAPQVRVNAIAPGPIIWASEDDPAHQREVLAKTPMARLGEARDIATAVEYLCDAPFVTGQVMEVDGGRSIFI